MQIKKKLLLSLVPMVLAIILSSFVSQAAQTNELAVRCHITQVSGYVDTSAPYVRVQIALASDLSQILATEEAEVRPNGSYHAVLRYTQQIDNTLLVVAIGEWDGQQYLYPASMHSRYCNQMCGTAPQATYEPTTPYEPTYQATPSLPEGSVIVSGEDCYLWPFAPSQTMLVGDEAVVVSNGLGVPVHVFADTSYSSPVVAYLSEGASMSVVGGPFCFYYNDLDEQASTRFWQVSVDGIVGWVSEYADLTLSGQGFVYFISPTTYGYPTPVPTNQPSPYYIEYFYSDQYAVHEGGCVTLSYWVIGSESISIFSSNWNEPTVVTNNPGQEVMCPYGPAGTSVSYILQANLLDGSFATQQIDVQIVSGQFEPTPVPTETSSYIAYFYSDSYEIQAGGCVTLSYWVVGAEQIELYSNWEPTPQIILDNPNQRVVCPTITVDNMTNDSVTYVLDVYLLNGMQDSAYITILVNQS